MTQVNVSTLKPLKLTGTSSAILLPLPRGGGERTGQLLPNSNSEWHQRESAFAGEAIDLQSEANVIGQLGREGLQRGCQRGISHDVRLLVWIEGAEELLERADGAGQDQAFDFVIGGHAGQLFRVGEGIFKRSQLVDQAQLHGGRA